MQIRGKNLMFRSKIISFLSSNSAFVIIIITKILVRKQCNTNELTANCVNKLP